MVQAIIAGRKTMTRRIVTPQPDDDGLWNDTDRPRSLQSTLKGWNGNTGFGESREWKCRYGHPGDILWVRESCLFLQSHPKAGWIYKADDHSDIQDNLNREGYKWRPSIHMPKEAARIWLEVTYIRVEKLQDIRPGDACEEGINYWNIDPDALEGGELQADFENYTWTEKKEEDPNYEDRYFPTFANCIDSFRTLWQSINGDQSWYDNPWVWAISFKVFSTTGKLIKPGTGSAN